MMLKMCRVKDFEYWFEHGLTFFDLSYYSDSSTSLGTALSKNVKSTSAWFWLGASSIRLSHHPDSFVAFGTKLSLDTRDSETWRIFSFQFGKLHYYLDGSAGYSTSLSLDVKKASAWYNLGVEFRNVYQHPDFFVAFGTGLLLEIKDAEEWGNFGGLLLYQHPDDIVAFSTCFSLNARNIKAWDGLYTGLWLLSKYPDSFVASSTILSLHAGDSSIWRSLSVVLGEASKRPDSFVASGTWLSVEIKNTEAWGKLGAYLVNSFSFLYTDSFVSFSTASSLNTKNFLSWKALGVTFLNSGIYTDSAEALATALALEPSSFEENKKIFIELLKRTESKELLSVWNSFNTALRDILLVLKFQVFRQESYTDTVNKILELASLVSFHIYTLSFLKHTERAIRTLEDFRGFLLYPFVSEEIRGAIRNDIGRGEEVLDYIDSPFKLSIRLLDKEEEKKEIFDKAQKALLDILRSKNIEGWFQTDIEKLDPLVKENESAVVYVFGFEGMYYLLWIYKGNGKVEFRTEKLSELNTYFDYNTMSELLSVNIGGNVKEVKSKVIKEALEDAKKGSPYEKAMDFTKVLDNVLKRTSSDIADKIKEFAIGKNVRRLYVVPCGELVNFPVHSLRTSDGKTLIEEFEIAYLPPVGMIGDNRDRSSKLDAVLVLEDNTQFSESEVLEKVFSETEVINSRSEFMKRVKDNQYWIVHISAHGHTKPESSELSWIKLPDGMITPTDILSLPEGFAEHAVMSSCLVGFGGRAGIDLSFGFPYAFLSRRVKSFLAPVFRVSEEGARIFFETYYRNLLKHEDVVKAFSQTCRTLEKADNPMKEWRYFLLYSSM